MVYLWLGKSHCGMSWAQFDSSGLVKMGLRNFPGSFWQFGEVVFHPSGSCGNVTLVRGTNNLPQFLTPTCWECFRIIEDIQCCLPPQQFFRFHSDRWGNVPSGHYSAEQGLHTQTSHYHHQFGLPAQVSLQDYGLMQVEVLAIVMLKCQHFVNQILRQLNWYLTPLVCRWNRGTWPQHHNW